MWFDAEADYDWLGCFKVRLFCENPTIIDGLYESIEEGSRVFMTITLPHVKELYLWEAVHTWQRPIFELRFEMRST